ncbi:hypothetical protein AZE42_11225 [Rhizopogon vesiculosus]|uniref:Uncharacterized protein n=1 Tax=Rhizopogon vesiculosus TaxID=180088 RepID=A0A1J8QBV5_9AGAM|nr:hypothetical protein AZE42_11225 [Rhizopogon vesiculosus]
MAFATIRQHSIERVPETDRRLPSPSGQPLDPIENGPGPSQ